MKQYSIIFFWGLLISFLGTLPPGALNITATQITAQQGSGAAMIFAMSSMLTEVIIVRLALTGMKRILARKKLFQILELVTAILLLAMTIGCFIAATKMGGLADIFPDYHLPAFSTGVVMTIINPLHIPFWLGWTSVLINKGVLIPAPRQYNWYIAGIGLGTFFGFLAFIMTGQFLLTSFENNQFIICLVVGIILLFVAALQIKKMIEIPVSVRYAKMNKEVGNS
ncbi:MAG: LysE family translocator [Chitinophagaceae bacterium]